MDKGHTLTNCLACGSNRLTSVLDFGEQPLANSYLELGELDQGEPKFPLGLNLCEQCSHLQLPYAVNPDLMFKDYLYVSGTSQTLRDYFEWFADFALEYHDFLGYKLPNVLDIACNDGSQLNSFKVRGCWTWGVDPAQNLYPLSTKNGHRVICDYLNQNVVKDLNNLGVQFDIINAQNVFAHNSDPKAFLEYCHQLMGDNTLLFIQNSQADMIKNGEFDTIYHEHHSFWCLCSMCAVAARTKLYVIDRIRTPIHGTSDLFILSKRNCRQHWRNNALQMEEKKGLWHPKTYVKYAKRVDDTLKDFKHAINLYQTPVTGQEGSWPVIGYGAAAKGNTLLNAANVRLDAIIDDNPLKQGRYTPGMNIPITSATKFDQIQEWKNTPILWVPLAWNFYDEIYRKIKSIRNNNEDLFLRYFPEIEIDS